MQFEEAVRELTGATSVVLWNRLQSLWSDYGEICRVTLKGAREETVIVKHIRFPAAPSHPRGWSTPRSHQRKVHSYEVELNWYHRYARLAGTHCRVAKCLGDRRDGDQLLLVLEDLDAAGYAERLQSADMDQLIPCIRWLAEFHSRFMFTSGDGLWPTGTYWHLATRPDELEALTDPRLKLAAEPIDQILSATPYLTLVHGDAKLANFCFSRSFEQVAAVDFQYVGRGCGMKDLAYLVGSALASDDCERYEQAILKIYFEQLKKALGRDHPDTDPVAVEDSWRPLYPFAWADFHRFVKGWNPASWKIHGYSERMTDQALSALERGNLLKT